MTSKEFDSRVADIIQAGPHRATEMTAQLYRDIQAERSEPVAMVDPKREELLRLTHDYAQESWKAMQSPEAMNRLSILDDEAKKMVYASLARACREQASVIIAEVDRDITAPKQSN